LLPRQRSSRAFVPLTCPPRCCVDLRRLTHRPSPCFGLGAPPSTFDLTAWPLTFSSAARAQLVNQLERTPPLVLHSPSRIPSAIRILAPDDLQRIESNSYPASHEIRCPYGAPSSESLLPGRSAPASSPADRDHRVVRRLLESASSRVSRPASFRLRRFSRP